MFQTNLGESGFCGAYDEYAYYPTMLHWSRVTTHIGIAIPKQKWEVEMGFNNSYHSPIIGKNGIIFYGDSKGNFKAISEQGEVLWTFEVGQQILTPVIGSDGTIYFGTSGPVSSKWYEADLYRVHKLYALNPDGTLKWIYDTLDHNRHPPVIGQDGTIYVVLAGAILLAINPDGTLKWKFQKKFEIPKPPVVSSNGDIYVVCNDKNIYCLDSEGNEKWHQFIGFNNQESYPFLSKAGIIYITSNLGDGFKLRAISPQGEIIHEYTLPFGFLTSSPIMVDNSSIYTLASHFRLISMNVDGQINWEVKLEGYPRSLPSIDKEGVIYLTTGNSIRGKSRSWIESIHPSGEKRWSYKVKGDISWPVLVPNKTMYVITQEYEKDRCKLIAICDKKA